MIKFSIPDTSLFRSKTVSFLLKRRWGREEAKEEGENEQRNRD